MRVFELALYDAGTDAAILSKDDKRLWEEIKVELTAPEPEPVIDTSDTREQQFRDASPRRVLSTRLRASWSTLFCRGGLCRSAKSRPPTT